MTSLWKLIESPICMTAERLSKENTLHRDTSKKISDVFRWKRNEYYVLRWKVWGKIIWKNIASLIVIAPALIILSIVYGSAIPKPIGTTHREEFPFWVPLLQRSIFPDRYKKLLSKEQLQCPQKKSKIPKPPNFHNQSAYLSYKKPTQN